MGYQLVKAVLASKLARELGLPLRGTDVDIELVRPLPDLVPGGLAFSKAALDAPGLAGRVVLAPPGSYNGGVTVIETIHPRLAFAQALQVLQKSPGFAAPSAPEGFGRKKIEDWSSSTPG